MSVILSILIPMLGGLALFLYGMKMMSNGLELVAGNEMKNILEKLTSNRFVSILIGAAVTAIIQSSSATTVMLVSFVSSGIMSLEGAIWIIYGANIGATMTNLLTSLDVYTLACLMAMIGVGMIVFLKKPKLNNIGMIIAGLGILFIGMKQMSTAVAPVKEMESFTSLMLKFSSPIPGVLFGTAFAGLIQSSGAAIGILQTFAETGAINLAGSVYLVFGMNIGTCITAALASAGGTKDAKRTAMMHFLYNVVGTVIFVIIMIICGSFITNTIANNISGVKGQIAAFNIIYKVSTSILFLPFGKYFVIAAKKIIKGDDDEATKKQNRLSNINLSTYNLGNISVAIASLSKEIDYMMLLVIQNVTEGFEALINHDNSHKEELYAREEEINQSRADIMEYMEKVSALKLNLEDSELIMSYYKVTNELERLGDYARHLMKYAESEKPLNPEAIEEVRTLYYELSQGFVLFEGSDQNRDSVDKLRAREAEVDHLMEQFLENQNQRVKAGVTTPSRMALYSNVLTDVQRMFDHMMKVVMEATKHNYSVIAPKN